MKILTTSQIRALDAYTIAHEPVSEIKLMERAAEAFVSAFAASHTRSAPIHVFCGKGNNGGDGLAIARLLKTSWRKVHLYVLDTGKKSSPCFDTNLNRLRSRIKVNYIKRESDIPTIDSYDTVIDALYGTGFKGELTGLSAALVSAINASGATVYSVDVPSGLDGGLAPVVPLLAVKADVVFTFHAPKLAFLLPEFADFVRSFQVLDIGLSSVSSPEFQSEIDYVEHIWIEFFLRKVSKFNHKGKNGHALIAAGSFGKAGAAVLAVKAALRSGAGLVTALVPDCAYQIMQTTNPEAMAMVSGEHELQTIPALSSFNAVGAGPGMGKSRSALNFLKALLDKSDGPLVLDADALNLLSENKKLLNKLPPGTVLTPHPGEFKRLAGEWKNDVERLELQRSFSNKYNVVVVLKGAHTTITNPKGPVWFNSTGNAGMAKGGSGDVLTGIIAALLAQEGYSSSTAALVGVYVHGFAGDIAKQSVGETALQASDIIAHLPKAFRLIENSVKAWRGID